MPTFVPNKTFGQLLSISSTNHIYTEIFRLEFSYIELWFSDQNYKPLKTEYRVNLTLVVNDRGIKPDIPVSPVICVKGYGFLSFVENTGKSLSQNLRSKYEKRLLNTATNGFETASKWAIQKTTEATVDLLENQIAEKNYKGYLN